MRVAVALLVAGSLLGGPALAADELKLATEKGCIACHSVEKKVIGPAYVEVAKKYKGDAKAPAVLADKIVKGGQGVWGPIPMPPNKVTDGEAKTLAGWILSL